MIIHSACGLLFADRATRPCQMHKNKKPLAELFLLLFLPRELVQAYWGAIL